MDRRQAFELPEGTKVKAKPTENSPYWYGTVIVSPYYGRGVHFESYNYIGDDCHDFYNMSNTFLETMEVVT